MKLVDYFVVVGYEDGAKRPGSEETDFARPGGKIIQRFPANDDENADQQEFDTNIHCFCQPHRGWRLFSKQEAPTFFVSVLTDIKGQRRYCACLTFLEPYTSNGRPDEYLPEDDDSAPLPIEPSKLYAAKSLVLISRLEYIDLFKSCLSLIYALYVDKRHSFDNKLLETVIANLLTIQVSAPGTALATQFTLGADDRHVVQATASLSVPATGSAVFKLFKEIGIVNVLKLVCAIIADFKILFFSKSYTKLYEASRALEALLFPLKYTGVYVPVLPCFGSFLEFPAAPTPYIIGVHAAYRPLIEEMHAESLQECLKVDLDGASVWVPQCVDDLICGGGIGLSMSSSTYSTTGSNNNNAANKSFSGLPHFLYESTLNLLFAILKPDVLHADELLEFSHEVNEPLFNVQQAMNGQSQPTNSIDSYSTSSSSSSLIHSANSHMRSSCSNLAASSPTETALLLTANVNQMSQAEVEAVWLDKLLRAVFVRMFAQLFAGYRYCLLVVSSFFL